MRASLTGCRVSASRQECSVGPDRSADEEVRCKGGQRYQSGRGRCRHENAVGRRKATESTIRSPVRAHLEECGFLHSLLSECWID